MELDEHFFRHEFGRLTAALTRMLGLENLPLAEDAVQDTLKSAVEIWSYRGIPEHHSAWLMRAAKNRAIDALRRQRTAMKHVGELQRLLEEDVTTQPDFVAERLPLALADDELRMMFTCCHPRAAEDVQVALVLSLTCGFSVREIANAFLIGHAAAEKRLVRGKKVLASSATLFELTSEDFAARVEAVQRALYLLFSEGYHGACAEHVVRVELCREAIRLVRLLLDHAPAATPATHALAALFYLCAARLPDRLDANGDLARWNERDRARWDRELIATGMAELEASASGDSTSAYHLEAGIAACHAMAPNVEATPWREIVSLYDVLLRRRPSAVVALNRGIAIAQADGPEKGLAAIRATVDAESLARYPFYPAAIGELELRCGRRETARTFFQRARALARNDAERSFLDRCIASCA